MRFFTHNRLQTDPFQDETDDFPSQITQDQQSSSVDITPFNSDTSNFSGIASFIRMLKQRKKFSDAAEADLELYSQTRDIEERLALHFAIALEERDLLKQLTKPDQWVISEDLKKSIGIYVKAFLLSPTVSSYKGNAAEHVLKAMNDLNVGGIPAEGDVIQVKELLSVIGTTLTAYRNTIKTKIIASLEDGSKTRNIADLTHEIIKNTTVVATLQLYIRLAFLRWHIVTFRKSADTWDEVDKTLVKWRKVATTEKDLTESFNMMYQEDKVTYGDPANTRHETTQPKNVPAWLKTIDSHSVKVLGAVASTGKKRKRME